MPEANTLYKDRLFNFLFGSEENREWTLSLCDSDQSIFGPSQNGGKGNVADRI